MKVNFSSKIGLESSYSNSKTQKNSNSEYKNVTDLSAMPNYKYMVSFGANSDTLEKLFTAYSDGKGMPITYETNLKAMTQEERAKITDVYANYKSTYAEMENCHTVEELKEKFPQEFEKLQSSFSKKESKGSYLTQLNEWSKYLQQNGEFLFPETKDNDISVYLAKKVYLEAKTKKEIIEDFAKDINPLLSLQDLQNLGSSRKKEDSGLIPESVYSQLGLRSDRNANGFRNSLSRSRQEYINKYGSVYREKRVATFNKTIDEVTSTTPVVKSAAPQKNSTNYEKYQYAMFYVWNNSMDLRHALSDFLIDHQQDNELLKPDFMGINSHSKTEDEKRKNQRNLMSMFWETNPDLRTDFGDKCRTAFDIVEKAIDNGSFGDLKKSIDADREKVFETLKQEKEIKEAELAYKKRQEELALAEQKRQQRIIELRKTIVDNLKKQMRDHLKEYSSYIPIPKSQYGKISSQLQELMEGKENAPMDEIRHIADCSFSGLTKKASSAIINATWDILNPKDIEFLKKSYQVLLTQNPQYRNRGSFELSKMVLEEEIQKTLGAFQAKIIHPYLCHIINNGASEMSANDKKKVLNKIYQDCVNSDTYAKLCTNDTRKFILEEMVKKLKLDISPKAVLDIYTKHFIKTPLKIELSTK